MDLLEKLKEQARKSKKRIVLPEGMDPRVVKAGIMAQQENIADIVILGTREDIEKSAQGQDISNIEIYDYLNSPKLEEYAQKLYELRKEKGLSLDEAKEMVKKYTYFGVMMVYTGDVDGMVCGAVTSTGDVFRPALQIVKTAQGVKTVSSAFIMEHPDKSFGSDGFILFADCALNENPTSEQLSDIAVASAKTFRSVIGDEPRVAMLSYSTYGSAKSEMVQKVVDATAMVREKTPDLLVDGEVQLDSALVPEVAELKTKGKSVIKGRANILVFPDINAGNIGVKIAERLGKCRAHGPYSQGLRKPINDLSRGCTAENVVGVIAVTAIQAQTL